MNLNNSVNFRPKFLSPSTEPRPMTGSGNGNLDGPLVDGPLKGLSVLLVDPDISFSTALAGHLAHHGAAVTSVTSGLDVTTALQTSASHVPVVVLELMLPGQSGVEVLSTLADLPNRPPVVVVTANHAARLKAYTQAMGASDYFVKPANFAAISAAIAHAAEAR
jgi:DNA-binding response OmpR family regulator